MGEEMRPNSGKHALITIQVREGKGKIVPTDERGRMPGKEKKPQRNT